MARGQREAASAGTDRAVVLRVGEDRSARTVRIGRRPTVRPLPFNFRDALGNGTRLFFWRDYVS